MHTLIIDRATWLHGDMDYARFGFTMLRNQKDLCCCLGFACEQSGLTKDDTRDAGTPLHVAYLLKDDKFGLLKKDKNGDGDSDLSMEAMRINDDAELSDEERETELIELFKTHGTEVKFTGEYPKP